MKWKVTGSETNMDPKLIAAAAKLCGWEQLNLNSDPAWQHWIDSTGLCANMSGLTERGLLALIQKLADTGWRYQKTGAFHEWLSFYDSDGRLLARRESDVDLATAACLAAHEEVGNE